MLIKSRDYKLITSIFKIVFIISVIFISTGKISYSEELDLKKGQKLKGIIRVGCLLPLRSNKKMCALHKHKKRETGRQSESNRAI